jgi:hypothetical protein
VDFRVRAVTELDLTLKGEILDELGTTEQHPSLQI